MEPEMSENYMSQAQNEYASSSAHYTNYHDLDPKESYIPSNQDFLKGLYGQIPTHGFFNSTQYLPLNDNFYMPPSQDVYYMDPYGIMNPAAANPNLKKEVDIPQKVPMKKTRFRSCC